MVVADALFALWFVAMMCGAAFYAHYAATGKSFRGWPTLRGGGQMSRGRAVQSALGLIGVGVVGLLIFPHGDDTRSPTNQTCVSSVLSNLQSGAAIGDASCPHP